jgi:hypothetical protein
MGGSVRALATAAGNALDMRDTSTSTRWTYARNPGRLDNVNVYSQADGGEWA